MKANMHVQQAWPQGPGGPFNGYELRLSIGMIVKNEERTLEKCLRSLQPLLEAIPGELIVTDTGSTDRTMQIAQKYADRLIQFDWTGDFSAARNTGLSVARGEWFLFIDADEWFEDVDELIKFFNSDECDDYGCGSYIQRNYSDMSGESYHDFHAPRLFRNYPGMQFVGIVHENIRRLEPCKFLNDYVHHYGYVFQSQKERVKKNSRNTDLLKEALVEHPDDLKAYTQLTQEYLVVRKNNDAFETAEKGLQMEKIHPSSTWKQSLLHHKAKVCMVANRYPDLLETGKEFVQSDFLHGIPYMDCLYYTLLAAMTQKDYGQAVQAGENYLKLYSEYKADQLDKSMLLYCSYDSLETDTHENALRLIIKAYIELRDLENAAACLNRLDLSLPGTITAAFPLVTETADKMNDWSLLSSQYKTILAMDIPEQTEIFIACVEAFLNTRPNLREELYRSFAETPFETENNYINLCRLRLAEQNGERQTALQLLERFAQCEELERHYSDILYFAMKENFPIRAFLHLFKVEDLMMISGNIELRHEDFCETLQKYLTAFSAETVKEENWVLCMLNQAVISRAREKDYAECNAFLEQYADHSENFIHAVYQSNFAQEYFFILPSFLRFGHLIAEAFLAKDQSDTALYLKNLKLALKEYPLMKDAIELLLNRFEEEEKEQQKNADEFFALAKEMKKRVKALISQGSLQEARQITMQLATLLPQDQDIQQLLDLTGAGQPPLPEMLSHIPQ